MSVFHSKKLLNFLLFDAFLKISGIFWSLTWTEEAKRSSTFHVLHLYVRSAASPTPDFTLLKLSVSENPTDQEFEASLLCLSRRERRRCGGWQTRSRPWLCPRQSVGGIKRRQTFVRLLGNQPKSLERAEAVSLRKHPPCERHTDSPSFQVTTARKCSISRSNFLFRQF